MTTRGSNTFVTSHALRRFVREKRSIRCPLSAIALQLNARGWWRVGQRHPWSSRSLLRWMKGRGFTYARDAGYTARLNGLICDFYERWAGAEGLSVRVCTALLALGMKTTATGLPLTSPRVNDIAMNIGAVRRRRRPPKHEPLFRTKGPKTRAECKDGPRPCPWMSCRWHLGRLAYRSARRTVIRPVFPRELAAQIEEGDFSGMRWTCALDVLDAEPMVVPRVAWHVGIADNKYIGDILGLTKQRVHQLVRIAIGKVQRQDPDVARFLQWMYEHSRGAWNNRGWTAGETSPGRGELPK